MRIDIKTVGDKKYLQYVDTYGHIYHIGPVDNIQNWKIAFWLYGYGLNELHSSFIDKMKVEIKKHLDIDKETWTNIQSYLGNGMSGYVGFYPPFREAINRIFDFKAMKRDDLRRAVKQKFPEIKTKEALRRTVDYNLKLQRKG